jgi:hypothetical protein
MKFLKKLRQLSILRRILVERLTEPIHLQVLALFIYIFGGIRIKIFFDFYIRQHHAYCILKCAEEAKSLNIKTVSLIEFGVANGAGLINISKISKKVTKITGIEFKIYGFDTGTGMPVPVSFKDHPELYKVGDYPMDFVNLKLKLDNNVELIIGDIDQTIQKFSQNILKSPIGFISLDVDYYSSSVQALSLLELITPNQLLPCTYLYVDDIEEDTHNSICGELGAIGSFNKKNINNIFIEKSSNIRWNRIFKNAKWIDKIFYIHNFNHEERSKILLNNKKITILDNPYL